MVENEYMYQISITPTFDLIFLIKFCGDDLLIIENIFIKFHEKNHLFNARITVHWAKLNCRNNGEELSSKNKLIALPSNI